MSKNLDTKVCFICSPNIGILDNWLPVISLIKKNSPNLNITALIPTNSIVRSIDIENYLVVASDDLFDEVIFKSFSGIWLKCSSFKKASSINTKFYNSKNLLSLASYLTGKRLSKFVITLWISKLIIFLLKKINNLEVISIYKEQIFDIRQLSEFKVLFYDIYIEQKKFYFEINQLLEKINKFSITHGPNYFQELNFNSTENKDKKIRSDVTVYTQSSKEHNYYNSFYNIPNKNIINAGIPKHDKSWMMAIQSYYSNFNSDDLFDEYILIISRPSGSNNNYFPYERKKKALEEIRNLFFNSIKRKIVIKQHPKESDANIFFDVFGKDNYGSKWVFSNNHVFSLAERALLTISFFSSVVLDMLALDIPVVEYLDLNGLSNFDNKYSLRDNGGAPVFFFRFNGLVHGASDFSQLEAHAKDAIKDPVKSIHDLQRNYRLFFSKHDNPAKLVADDILRRI